MAITDYIVYFTYVLASIFVIVNPIQATMIFISLTSGTSIDERRKVSRRATSIAFGIAMVFALGGDAILRFFGITVDSLMVAGGILLFLVALDMLKARENSRKVTEAELRDANLRDDVSVFPLATPLLTGPGAMTTVIVHMGRADFIGEKGLVILAIIVTFVATYKILEASEFIQRILGVTGIMVLTRTQGLILGAIAVNFVITGAWNLVSALAGS